VPRPGVDVEVVPDATAGGPILDTGQGFFAGATQRGPLLKTVTSIAQYKSIMGDRSGGSLMYDSVNAFFSEGGGTAIISRNVAAAAASAFIAFGTGLKAVAISPGTWANGMSVEAQTPPGVTPGPAGSPIVIAITYAGALVEASRVVNSVDEAMVWAHDSSNYIRFDPGAGAATLPIHDTEVTLAGGTNGTVSNSDMDTTLSRFTYEMGPGQVQVPGIIDADIHERVGNHIEANHRCAIIDLDDDNDPAALIAARSNMNGLPGARSMLMMAPWLYYPSETPPAQVVIPYSGVQAGIVARVDKNGDSASVAAGKNGISQRALGLTQTFSDTDRETLNANGVNLGKQMYGLVRTYGYRTAAGPDINDNWTFFQESRVVMSIAHQSTAAIEEYVFDTVDGLGHLFVQVKNVLTGICQKFWKDGSLFGAEPNQAFRVVCDFTTNTIETIKAGEIHAIVYLRTSKVAEWVKVEIVKVPTEREV
jgi:uncharacterized protein